MWEQSMHIALSALWWEPRLPGPLRRGRLSCCLAPEVPAGGGEVPEEWRMCVGRVDMWPRPRLQRWKRWEGSYSSFRKGKSISNHNSNTCFPVEGLENTRTERSPIISRQKATHSYIKVPTSSCESQISKRLFIVGDLQVSGLDMT